MGTEGGTHLATSAMILGSGAGRGSWASWSGILAHDQKFSWASMPDQLAHDQKYVGNALEPPLVQPRRSTAVPPLTRPWDTSIL